MVTVPMSSAIGTVVVAVVVSCVTVAEVVFVVVCAGVFGMKLLVSNTVFSDSTIRFTSISLSSILCLLSTITKAYVACRKAI